MKSMGGGQYSDITIYSGDKMLLIKSMGGGQYNDITI